MYSKIVQVYKFGVRRDEREISNDPGRVGNLSLHHHDRHPVLIFQDRDNVTPTGQLLPNLYEPRCVGMGNGLMLWRGYQKPRQRQPGELAPAFLQEWRVEVIDRYKPEDTNPFPQFGEVTPLKRE